MDSAMKVLVPVKRVLDYNLKVRVKPDGSGVVLDGVKLSINPFDAIAIEEALRIKERGQADEVVVATLGPADCQSMLRNALAMGAQRALHDAARSLQAHVAGRGDEAADRNTIRTIVERDVAVDVEGRRTVERQRRVAADRRDLRSRRRRGPQQQSQRADARHGQAGVYCKKRRRRYA